METDANGPKPVEKGEGKAGRQRTRAMKREGGND